MMLVLRARQGLGSRRHPEAFSPIVDREGAARRGRVMTLLAVVLLVAACSTSVPWVSPTQVASPIRHLPPSPSPSQTPPPSASATIYGESVTLAISGGANVQFPADALPAGTTVSISADQPSGGPTDAWPADAVGFIWTIEVDDAALAKPVILTLPFDMAALPRGAGSGDLILAYRDIVTHAWLPVSATVDPTAQTVTATVDHLSEWGLFTIDWDYWVAFIKQVAAGNLGDFLNGVVTITDTCATESPAKSPVFTLDNGATNGMVKGCITDSTKTSAAIRMTNLRAFRLQVFGSALDAANGSLLASGESVTFSVGGNQAQPVVVAADLDALGLGYDITDIVLRLLPGSDLIKDAGTYSKVLDEIMTAQSKLWTSATILEDLKAGKVTSAASATVELLTSETYLTTLLDALHAVGTARGVPLLASLSKEGIKRVLTVVNLTDLIVTTFTFITQYFITAHSEVSVSWVLAVAPPKPAPPAAPSSVTVSARGAGRTIYCDGNECYYADALWDSRPPGDPSPWRLTWNDVESETGYRVYVAYKAWYWAADPDDCGVLVDELPHLLAKLSANTTSLNGSWTAEGDGTKAHPYIVASTYSVAAVNGAGASKRTASKTIWYADVGSCASP